MCNVVRESRFPFLEVCLCVLAASQRLFSNNRHFLFDDAHRRLRIESAGSESVLF